MDATDLVDAVREDTKTELSRIGSSKSLYADTRGEMKANAVLEAAADAAHHAGETFAGWGDDSGGVFAAAADRERGHYDAIADKLDGHEAGDPPAVVDFLRGQDSVIERLGGLVGWSLVLEKKTSQYSGFFTGQADPRTASLFRGFGDDYEATRAEALDALGTVCEGDDWDGARAAATGAVEAAYDEYFETLEELGVSPKPVC